MVKTRVLKAPIKVLKTRERKETLVAKEIPIVVVVVETVEIVVKMAKRRRRKRVIVRIPI
jgi:predicted aspartyl protease